MSDSVTHKTIADGATGTVPAASTALAAADDAARHYANRSRSDSTWRAYEADWRQFISWCADTGSTPLPASAQTVARFLAIQASPCPKRPRGLAPATLKRRLAAIRLMHLGAELPSPHIAPEVNEVLRGIVNAHRDTAGQQKRPVLDEDICRMVDTLNGNTLRALRDRAVLLLGFAGALRRSEIVALDVHHLEQRSDGLLVTISHSKADQAGVGQQIAIPAQMDSPYCPVAAIERWRLAANIRSGAVFRRFYRGDSVSELRLSAQSVASIVKDTVLAIGKNPREFGAHSLRHGFLTQAARNRADLFRMAAQSRHRDIRTVMTYVEAEARFEDHPGHDMLKTRQHD